MAPAEEKKKAPVLDSPETLQSALGIKQLEEVYASETTDKNAFLQRILQAVVHYAGQKDACDAIVKRKMEANEDATEEEKERIAGLETILDAHSRFLLGHTYVTELTAATSPGVLAFVAQNDKVNKPRLLNDGLRHDLAAANYRVLALVLGDGPPDENTILAALYAHPSCRKTDDNGKTSDAGLWKSLDGIFTGEDKTDPPNNATFFGVTSVYEGKMKHVGDVMIAKGMRFLNDMPSAGATTLSPMRIFRKRLEARLKEADDQRPFFPKAARDALCRIAREHGVLRGEQGDANRAFLAMFGSMTPESVLAYNAEEREILSDIIRHVGITLMVEERRPDGKSLFPVGNMHMGGDAKGGAYVADIIPPFTATGIHTFDPERWAESFGTMVNYRYDDTCGHRHRLERSRRYTTVGELSVSNDLLDLYNQWEVELAREQKREISPAGFRDAFVPGRMC